LEAPPPPPRRGGSQHQICPGNNCNGTATTFLQLSQEHLKQPGMKLFPNYTPPIPPHSDGPSNTSANFSTLSNNVNNHHYHQITYHTQTLAPLRLNQDHFNVKTNTLAGCAAGIVSGSDQPNGRQKYQTHHHHHHHQHQHPQQQQQQQQQSHHHHHHHPQLSDHELEDDDVFDDNEDDSNNSGTASPLPPSVQLPASLPSTPTPPDLPIRNGLATNYNVNTLNHINNNTATTGGGIRENGVKMSSPGVAAIGVGVAGGERPVTTNRKAMRHYH
ncbi:GATA zinc finger domain-containing protein 10-like, partial [Wyeomyia smithii]|uniref:GATA zinc finger domain-containing protein 10-like n=1 Tax=Wyeomyia smithii TaxID=174621 RepID=UPI002467AF32